MSVPCDRQSVGIERESCIRCCNQRCRASCAFLWQAPFGRRNQAFAIPGACRRIDSEGKTVDAADGFVLDRNDSIVAHNDIEQRGIIADLTHQYGGSAVDEAFGQTGVERVRQLFLDGLRAHGPMCRVFEPVGALGDVGPCPHSGNASPEGVDVAFNAVEPGKFIGEPGYWNIAVIFTDMAEDTTYSPPVVVRPDFAKVRQTTSRPQPRDHIRMAGTLADGGIFGEAFQDREIDGFGCRAQGGGGRFGRKRRNQCVDTRQIGIALAPIQMLEFRKVMLFDGVDLFGTEGRRTLLATQTAERSVLLVPPRAPGNLRHFGHGQPPLPPPVELVQRCKRDMRDVHVEPHANGIGRDEIVDFACLIHGNLRIAGTGGQRTHDHRRPAARPAQQFGDRINFLRAERDDHRPFGQPRQFLCACIAER